MSAATPTWKRTLRTGSPSRPTPVVLGNSPYGTIHLIERALHQTNHRIGQRYDNKRNSIEYEAFGGGSARRAGRSRRRASPRAASARTRTSSAPGGGEAAEGAAPTTPPRGRAMFSPPMSPTAQGGTFRAGGPQAGHPPRAPAGGGFYDDELSSEDDGGDYFSDEERLAAAAAAATTSGAAGSTAGSKRDARTAGTNTAAATLRTRGAGSGQFRTTPSDTTMLALRLAHERAFEKVFVEDFGGEISRGSLPDALRAVGLREIADDDERVDEIWLELIERTQEEEEQASSRGNGGAAREMPMYPSLHSFCDVMIGLGAEPAGPQATREQKRQLEERRRQQGEGTTGDDEIGSRDDNQRKLYGRDRILSHTASSKSRNREKEIDKFIGDPAAMRKPQSPTRQSILEKFPDYGSEDDTGVICGRSGHSSPTRRAQDSRRASTTIDAKALEEELSKDPEVKSKRAKKASDRLYAAKTGKIRSVSVQDLRGREDKECTFMPKVGPAPKRNTPHDGQRFVTAHAGGEQDAAVVPYSSNTSDVGDESPRRRMALQPAVKSLTKRYGNATESWNHHQVPEEEQGAFIKRIIAEQPTREHTFQPHANGGGSVVPAPLPSEHVPTAYFATVKESRGKANMIRMRPLSYSEGFLREAPKTLESTGCVALSSKPVLRISPYRRPDDLHDIYIDKSSEPVPRRERQTAQERLRSPTRAWTSRLASTENSPVRRSTTPIAVMCGATGSVARARSRSRSPSTWQQDACRACAERPSPRLDRAVARTADLTVQETTYSNRIVRRVNSSNQ